MSGCTSGELINQRFADGVPGAAMPYMRSRIATGEGGGLIGEPVPILVSGDTPEFYTAGETYSQEPTVPAAVKQARKIANGWDRHVTALRRSYESKRSDKFAEARKLLNFGTPAEALAAVEALEALS